MIQFNSMFSNESLMSKIKFTLTALLLMFAANMSANAATIGYADLGEGHTTTIRMYGVDDYYGKRLEAECIMPLRDRI